MTSLARRDEGMVQPARHSSQSDGGGTMTKEKRSQRNHSSGTLIDHEVLSKYLNNNQSSRLFYGVV